MGVTLEWAQLPDGVYLKTICRNGIPLPDVRDRLGTSAYEPTCEASAGSWPGTSRSRWWHTAAHSRDLTSG
jgi:hypothetical protein